MLRVSGLLLSYGLLALVFGCGEKTRAGAAAAEGITEVRLGYFPNVTHAQAVLGVASGDFAAALAPVKFSPRVFNAGPALIEALFAGDVDVAYVGPGPVINAYARSHGEGIRVISGAADNGVLIVARKGSGIHSMVDLKGRNLATPQMGNTQDIAARHYLMADLHQTDLANIRPVANSNVASLMARGQIDAAWTPEPWGSLLIAEAGAIPIGREQDLWPGRQFALTVIVTTPDFLGAHPDIVRKLLAVNHRWTRRLAEHPERYAVELGTALKSLTGGKSLPDDVIAAALSHVKFTEDPSAATFTADAKYAKEVGFAHEVPDVSGLIDLRMTNDETRMTNQ